MKKDISNRLAHKEQYKRIDKNPEKQIDLLIVVDQMLTGFDSKWINTLYMDKVLEYENIIQAFSRTNRLFGPDKPFGTIKYYRRPHTMEKNIEKAVKLYSGNKPLGLFVDRLNKNLEFINGTFNQIKDLFDKNGIADFIRLPDDVIDRKKFSSLFKELNDYLEAAKIQGFTWSKQNYNFIDPQTNKDYTIIVNLDEKTYKILVLRYKELFQGNAPGTSGSIEDPPYDLDGTIISIETDDIDLDFMNSRFKKYLKIITK